MLPRPSRRCASRSRREAGDRPHTRGRWRSDTISIDVKSAVHGRSTNRSRICQGSGALLSALRQLVARVSSLGPLPSALTANFAFVPRETCLGLFTWPRLFLLTHASPRHCGAPRLPSSDSCEQLQALTSRANAMQIKIKVSGPLHFSRTDRLVCLFRSRELIASYVHPLRL